MVIWVRDSPLVPRLTPTPATMMETRWIRSARSNSRGQQISFAKAEGSLAVISVTPTTETLRELQPQAQHRLVGPKVRGVCRVRITTHCLICLLVNLWVTHYVSHLCAY